MNDDDDDVDHQPS